MGEVKQVGPLDTGELVGGGCLIAAAVIAVLLALGVVFVVFAIGWRILQGAS